MAASIPDGIPDMAADFGPPPFHSNDYDDMCHVAHFDTAEIIKNNVIASGARSLVRSGQAPWSEAISATVFSEIATSFAAARSSQ